MAPSASPLPLAGRLCAAIVYHKWRRDRRATRARPANQRRRFGQKTGFGERRCDAWAVRAKIFLLPKIATQSPRRMLASAAEARQQHPLHAIRDLREARKRLRRRRFLQHWQSASSHFRALRAAIRQRIVVSPGSARYAPRLARVNTSLSGTVFFLTCWCIRDAVHFDSRVHAAISHLTSEGNMAKKAKKAKKAKSAVKKTAKKTRKVAKKK
ncbi:hypothetical protein [Bradyrhizobium sp.]|uniref:hypothetical protein n=1 Tax=Bradyrhizobium sp. TaxID=376 RepID=UPI003C17828D